MTKKIILCLFIVGGTFSAFSKTRKHHHPKPKTIIASQKGEVFFVVPKMPSYSGGELAMVKFLNDNIVYPPLAMQNNVQGKVQVRFVIDKNGDRKNYKIISGIGSGCDEAAINVTKAMPRWKPGMQSGRKVSVYYTLPISFYLNGPTKTQTKTIITESSTKSYLRVPIATTTTQTYNGQPVYTAVAEMPIFMEGNLSTYIQQNFVLLERPSQQPLAGYMEITYVIDTLGYVKDVRAKESQPMGYTNEVSKLFYKMPRWKPGKNNGKKVNVLCKYTLQLGS